MAYASTYDESAFGGGGGDGELIKLLVGSRARRSRLRRLLLAKLIRDSRSEETGTDEDYDDESEDDDSPNLARLLIGRGMRRRRLRKLLLAKLLRERGAGDDEGEDIDDEGDDDHRLARLLVGRRMVRRAKLVASFSLSCCANAARATTRVRTPTTKATRPEAHPLPHRCADGTPSPGPPGGSRQAA